MSPPWGVGLFQAGIAVVERDPAIESLVKLDFCSREAEAPVLRGDLEAAALPLHDVVVADDPFVKERTDAVELVWSRTPGFGGLAGNAREAAVVVGDKASQHTVGGGEVASLREAEFAAQAVLEHTPEPFDAAFGLRTLGSNEGNAEIGEGAAELRRLTLSSEFFFDSPRVIVADEDTAAVPVEGGGDAETAEQALEQAEIGIRRFFKEETRRDESCRNKLLPTRITVDRSTRLHR